MRIDLRHRVSIAASLLALMSFVYAPADPVADTANGNTEAAVPSESDSSTGGQGEQTSESGDETAPAEPFIPSEKISADSAVSFPVDI